MKVAFLEKFPLYVRLVYGALVVFAFLGVVLGKPLGTMVGIIVAIMWTLSRILEEARAAWQMLGVINKIEEGEEQVGKDDESDPPNTTL